MSIIHVRAMVDFTVDTDAYAAAFTLEESGEEPLDPTDHDEIGQHFLTLEYETLVPRFAWHCITMTGQQLMTGDEPFPSLFVHPESNDPS